MSKYRCLKDVYCALPRIYCVEGSEKMLSEKERRNGRLRVMPETEGII